MILIGVVVAVSYNPVIVPCIIGGYSYCVENNTYSLYIKTNINTGNPLKYCVNTTGGSKCFMISPQVVKFENEFGGIDFYSVVQNSTVNISGNKITWNNAFINHTLEYEVLPHALKETIRISGLREPSLSGSEAYYTQCSIIDFDSGLDLWIGNSIWNKNSKLTTTKPIAFTLSSTGELLFFLPISVWENEKSFYEVQKKGNKLWLCTKFNYTNANFAFPASIDPAIDQPNAAEFEFTFSSGTKNVTLTDYTYSSLVKAIGVYNETDIKNAQDFCEYRIISPNIVGVKFTSSFQGWLNLTNDIVGGDNIMNGTYLFCNRNYIVNWQRKITFFDDSSYTFEWRKT